MSTQDQLAKQTGNMKKFLSAERFHGELEKLLPANLSPERFARIAITTLTKTPKLANCTQESFFNCLLDLSSYGLEPNGRDAYLIPRGTECTLNLDYKGIVKLIRRSKDIADIYANVVHEKDQFDIEFGAEQRLTHKPYLGSDRGAMIGAYSYCKFKDGTANFIYMNAEDVEAVRKKSQTPNAGPWVDFTGEMWKKSAIRRHSKTLPLDGEITEAIEKLDRDSVSKMKHADTNVFDDAFGAPATTALEDGEATAPEGKKKKQPPASAEETISDERIDAIKNRLLDDEKMTEDSLLLVIKGKFPECTAEKLADLTPSEAAYGMKVWDGEAK